MARYFESHDSRPQTLYSINRVTLTPDVTTPAVPGSAEALHSGWEGYGGSSISGWEGYGGSSISRDQPMKRKSTKRPARAQNDSNDAAARNASGTIEGHYVKASPLCA